MAINENVLSKGHQRKLQALRKSLGDKIADKAFQEWMTGLAKSKPKAKKDAVAERLIAALKPLEKDRSVNLGRSGYSVRRAKGKGAKGFVVERIQKPVAEKAPKAKKKVAKRKSKKASAATKR